MHVVHWKVRTASPSPQILLGTAGKLPLIIIVHGDERLNGLHLHFHRESNWKRCTKPAITGATFRALVKLQYGTYRSLSCSESFGLKRETDSRCGPWPLLLPLLDFLEAHLFPRN